jgi:uncharacterized membrane protein YsdA (DUF1294 family)
VTIAVTRSIMTVLGVDKNKNKKKDRHVPEERV